MHLFTLLALPVSLLAMVQGTPVPPCDFEPAGCERLERINRDLGLCLEQMSNVVATMSARAAVKTAKEIVESEIVARCLSDIEHRVSCVVF